MDFTGTVQEQVQESLTSLVDYRWGENIEKTLKFTVNIN